MIETERLLLRPIIEEDAQDIYEYSKDEAVGIDAGWAPHKTQEETQKIIKEVFLGQEDVFGIVEKESGKVIGSVGFMPDSHRENDQVRMLGYALGRNYWGKGYMTEAVKAVLFYGFLKKNVPLISVTHYTYNLASQRVIEKSGFLLEGIQRQGAKRFDGVVLDLKCYSVTKEEFFAKR